MVLLDQVGSARIERQKDQILTLQHSLPLCGISLTALFVFLPSKPTDGNMKAKLKAVDYGGSVASLVATVLLLMGVTWGGTTYAWVSPQGERGSA
jgi:hypothetical protein